MRKINAKCSNSDRVVCVTIPGKHEFYYQPVGTREQIWLFSTKDFSGDILNYFRGKGRNMSGRGFSLTIRELHGFKAYQNHKLAAVMKRIPGQVEYVIRERSADESGCEKTAAAHQTGYRCVGRDTDACAA